MQQEMISSKIKSKLRRFFRIRRRLSFKSWKKKKASLFFLHQECESDPTVSVSGISATHVAGAWTERKKMFHGGSFLKLADDV